MIFNDDESTIYLPGDGIVRPNEPNLKKYLPSFHVDHNPDLKDTLTVESWEHERIRGQIQDLWNQMFVGTATWSLSTYEEILGIVPLATDTDKQRRLRILLYLQSKQISTLDFMTKLIKRYCTADTEIRVREDYENYQFWADVDGGILLADDLVQAVELYKPAHLQMGIRLDLTPDWVKYEDENIIHHRVGFLQTQIGVLKLNPEKPKGATTNQYVGFANYQYGKMRMPIDGLNTTIASNTYTGFIHQIFGKMRIGADMNDLPSHPNYNHAMVGAMIIDKAVARKYPIEIPVVTIEDKAKVNPKAGFAAYIRGKQTFGVNTYTEVKNKEYVGIASFTHGRKSFDIDLAFNGAKSNSFVGFCGTKTGRMRMDADRSDIVSAQYK